MTEASRTFDVAVIGMSGRFPGAADIDAFWKNLCEGRESIRFFSASELAAAGVPYEEAAQTAYVPACAALDDAERFDAEFFGMGVRESRLTDPQQRVFLECAWAALENAGYDSQRIDGAVAVYAAAGLSTYLFQLENIAQPYSSERGFQILVGNDKDFLASHVSYKLDLRGPSCVVQTACSSGLAVIHHGVQALLAGECDIALAGAVSIVFPQDRGYKFQRGTVVSADGHCRPFDAEAGGTVLGNGCGVVVLKRLSDAQVDGDHIYAVIRGSALNNDGALKMSYTAPRVEGQAEVIRNALRVAEVEPASVSYVEAHGTGTDLGDPIEVAALSRVFEGVEPGSCALGSVKSNIGHLNTAAGIAGFIKVVLALERSSIPGTLHFRQPNAKLNLERTAFRITAQTLAWPARLRRAGVSSFGIGGTNAHIVLEQTPDLPAHSQTPSPELLMLSARTDTALQQCRERLSQRIGGDAQLAMADVSYTLAVGRRAFSRRWAAVVDDTASAQVALSSTRSRQAFTGVAPERAPRLVWLCPGQGSQWAGMGQGLYEVEPVFRDACERCMLHMDTELRQAVRSVLLEQDAAATGAPARTDIAQPALFVIEYALAETWRAAGVRPDVVLGHSLGELVAACLAGVLELPEMVRMVAIRARLMAKAPAGAMLAVSLSEAMALERLHGRPTKLHLAAVNGPASCVISGDPEAVAAFETKLKAAKIACKRLRVSHAFHSPYMDQAALELERALAGVGWGRPKLPHFSNITGGVVDADRVCRAEYWGQQLRATVRFDRCLSAALPRMPATLLEIGPGNALSSLARSSVPEITCVASMRNGSESRSDWTRLLLAAAQLWTAGTPVRPEAWRGGSVRRRVPLPSYPFEGDVYSARLSSPLAPVVRVEKHAQSAPEPAPGSGVDEHVVDRVSRAWFSALGITAVEASDDFFRLGGQSLVASELSAALSGAFGIEIPIRLLLENPTFGDYLAAVGGLVQGEPSTQANGDDESLRPPALPLEIAGPAAAGRLTDGASLVTGATGFLGAFLLHALLTRTPHPVICLVRAQSDEAARARLVQALRKYRLYEAQLMSRVTVLAADVAQERFGLPLLNYELLLSEVSDVYHLAAWVNFLYPYATLKPANVDSVVHVLRFCVAARPKRLHHVSTCAIFETPEYAARTQLDEAEPVAQIRGLRTGYQRSKWAAECLVHEARARGIPVAIYRPGAVWGDSRTGACNLQDLSLRMLAVGAAWASIPDWDLRLQPAPVDYVAAAIVELSRTHGAWDGAYHLVSPYFITPQTLHDMMRELGRAVRVVSAQAWLARVAEEASPQAALVKPFLSMLRPGYQLLTPRIACDRTCMRLDMLGIECPQITARMLAPQLAAFERLQSSSQSDSPQISAV